MSVLFTRRGPAPSPVRIISFNFRPCSNELQAEEGMTWGEWIESDYNTIGIYLASDGRVMYQTYYGVFHDDDVNSSLQITGDCQTSDDVIEENILYYDMA